MGAGSSQGSDALSDSRVSGRIGLSRLFRLQAIWLFPATVAVHLLLLSAFVPMPLAVPATAIVFAGIIGFLMRRDPMPARLYLRVTAVYAMYAGIEVLGRAMTHLFLRLYVPAQTAIVLSLLVTTIAIFFVAGAAAGLNALGGLRRDHNGQALACDGIFADRVPLNRVWARPLLLSLGVGIVVAAFMAWWQPAYRGLAMIAVGGPVGLAILFAIAAGRTIQLAGIVTDRERGKNLQLMVPLMNPQRR